MKFRNNILESIDVEPLFILKYFNVFVLFRVALEVILSNSDGFYLFSSMNYLFVIYSYFYSDKGVVTQCIEFSNFFRIAQMVNHSHEKRSFLSDIVKQEMDTMMYYNSKTC